MTFSIIIAIYSFDFIPHSRSWLHKKLKTFFLLGLLAEVEDFRPIFKVFSSTVAREVSFLNRRQHETFCVSACVV